MLGLGNTGAAFLRRRPGTVRVKICCIASDAEADLAIDAGADALGLVSAMPSGPGPIAEESIESIVRSVGTRAATVLLTSRQDAASIGAQLDRIGPTVVQFVDELAEWVYAALRVSHPSVVLMQVIHVRDEDAVREAVAVAPFVDALLLDSGNPKAAVKELGGTGRVHDWSVSRAICDAVQRPVFLAGGLRADNVAEAVERVRPFGVDICSGVRTEGRLDRDKLRAFLRAARSSLTTGE
ncbi:MAG: phosphoribosylanthranilate isomerase [Gemmatimonadota bacterium]|nr:phosphoribosylanthranilate isomerase [Gemmatimonadota bacterium]